MVRLRLADELSLPLDAATQTFLIVGKRGSGKSSTATRLAEQMIRREIPIAVLDPVDAWWGLKSGVNGQSAGGLNVYIFGGKHGDLPLESSAGSVMADVLVDHRVSAVFVLRSFSNREKARFVSDFAEQLFKRNQDVLHLFAEESHELMPQGIQFRGTGEEEMLGRMLRLHKLGRGSGIGMTCITQRPASLNKNATTQSEVLVAHRILGPQDRDAVEEWIKYHRQDEKKRAVMETLAELKTGEAWLWAPDFPEEDPFGLRRIKVLAPETFDSRQTPKPGQRRPQPASLAPVDLEKLRSKMAATIERSKAEDPRELRKQLAEARAEIGRLQKAQPTPAEVKTVEVPIIAPGQIERIEAIRGGLEKLKVEMFGTLSDVMIETGKLVDAVRAHQAKAQTIPARSPRPISTHIISTKCQPKLEPLTKSGRAGTETVPPARQRILDALAWLESIGLEDAHRIQLALLADASPKSSAYSNNLGGLRTAGLIDYSGAGRVILTGAGRAIAHVDEIPRTSEDVQAAILRRLKPAKARILRVLIGAYPQPIRRDPLAGLAAASATSSAYANNLGSLRSLGVIEYRPDGVMASAVLFLEGR